jgi:hypothetical protein
LPTSGDAATNSSCVDVSYKTMARVCILLLFNCPSSFVSSPRRLFYFRLEPLTSRGGQVDSPAAYAARTLYTEMEMFVPVAHTVAAVTDFLAFQDSVRSQLPPGAEALLYNQVRP